MSKLITIKIDVTKIDKNRLFKGEKGTYLDADIWLNDEPDKFGNDASVSMAQTKEERTAKAPKIYIGSAKKKFGWENEQPARSKPAATRYEGRTQDDAGDDIPF